jgi:hypothetical protein
MEPEKRNLREKIITAWLTIVVWFKLIIQFIRKK